MGREEQKPRRFAHWWHEFSPSTEMEPRFPVEKLSRHRTLFTSKSAAVPPDETSAIGRWSEAWRITKDWSSRSNSLRSLAGIASTKDWTVASSPDFSTLGLSSPGIV